jgi:molybdenum cofactor cytidylyltransferase
LKQAGLSVLIPAAGASTRLGQAKQLLRHGKRTLIRHAIDNAVSCDPAEIIVITGARASDVRDAAGEAPVRWVHNPRWREGLGVSIASGANAIGPDSGAVLILLCDQWRIGAGDLQALLSAWRAAPGRIAAARVGGHFTPPVIFPAVWFDALRRLTGDRGARSLLESDPGVVTAVPLDNAAFDLDTPDHLKLLENQSL